jgi:two-component sensor histidine kinase
LEDFTARLGALAAAQAILIDAETKPAMLSDVVRDALAPHLTADNRSIVSGEAVAITGRHAHALTLALHELATNSIKYGALSVRGGLLEILWTFVDGELDFLWRESNGPPVMTPTRIGFGSSLITQNLKAAFAGALDLSFKSSGVECRLRAQLPENVAA